MVNYHPVSWSSRGRVDSNSIKVVPFTVEVTLQSSIGDIFVLVIYTMVCTLVTCLLELLQGLWLPKNSLCRTHWNDYKLNKFLDYLFSPLLHVELIKERSEVSFQGLHRIINSLERTPWFQKLTLLPNNCVTVVVFFKLSWLHVPTCEMNIPCVSFLALP